MAIDALMINVALDEPQAEPAAAASPEAKKAAMIDRLDGKWVQTAGLLGLGFGGALLARYYAQIGFLPDIDWRESLTYLSVISLSGVCLVTLYGLLLFLPGVIWSVVLIADPALEDLMCFEAPPSKVQPCLVGISKALGGPFAVFFLIAHVPMLGAWEASWVFVAGILGLVPALIWLGTMLFRELKRRPGLRDRQRRPQPLWSLLARHLTFFALSCLVSLSSLVALYLLLSPGSSSSTSPALLLTCSLLSVVANVAVAMLFRPPRVKAVIAAVVAAFLLFLASETIPKGWDTLSARIAAQFGVGDQTDQTLVLNDDGAELAASLGLHSEDADSGASVDHVHILSRLGSSYLLEIAGRRVVFPKSMVLAWATPPKPLG